MLHGFQTFLACAAALACFSGHSQILPDAGTLQQQFDRENRSALPKPVPSDIQKSAPKTVAPAGATVIVKHFVFTGNRQVRTEDLKTVVAPWVDRALDFAQLQAIASRVDEFYRQRGWLARAVLPRQDITAGTVLIQIAEASFGGIVADGTPARVSPERLSRFIETALPSGQPLNLDQLNRGYLNADDLAGVKVVGSLKAGTKPGETLLHIHASDEPFFQGLAYADNYGSRVTGYERLNGVLALNSPFKLGDQILLNATHSQGTNYGRLGYLAPVGYDGLRVGVNTSYLDYRLVGNDFSALDAKGSAATFGVEGRYPLLRSRERNLYLQLAYDHKRYDNQAIGLTISRYQVSSATMGAVGNIFDDLGGGGSTIASTLITQGSLNLGGSPNQADDAASTRTAGQFGKLRYSLSRLQTVAGDLSLYVGVQGQLANKNLDSSEKFYLGGPYGVRAYPINEGGGSEGTLFNVELRQRLSAQFQLSAFYDLGRVRVNKNNDCACSPTINSYPLQGYGAGIAWFAPYGTNLQAIWARRIGTNPNPTIDGMDQDASKHLDRFWLTGSIAF